MITRRGLLLTAAVLGAARKAAAAEKVCADPAKLDSDQKSLRASLNYVEPSPDSAKACRDCGFFQPAGDGCGTCQIFSGPASANGHCDSWAAKG